MYFVNNAFYFKSKFHDSAILLFIFNTFFLYAFQKEQNKCYK